MCPSDAHTTRPARSGSAAGRGPLANPEARPWLVDRGEIGRGGMGSVHRVQDKRLRRFVAMKVLAGKGASPERFTEEAQITGQLDHPNIPPVHDFWVDERGQLCFSMKLVEGETLAKVLTRQPPALRTDAKLAKIPLPSPPPPRSPRA